jgi:hypothetical protein
MKVKLWLKIEKYLAFITNSKPTKNCKKLCSLVAKTKLKKLQNFVVYQVRELNSNPYIETGAGIQGCLKVELAVYFR